MEFLPWKAWELAKKAPLPHILHSDWQEPPSRLTRYHECLDYFWRERRDSLGSYLGETKELGTFEIYNARFFNKKQQDLITKRGSELGDRLKSNEDNDVKAPLKFKSFSKWDEYIDSLDDYFDSVWGVADTQLSYVTREESIVTSTVLSAQCDTLEDYYVRCVALRMMELGI